MHGLAPTLFFLGLSLLTFDIAVSSNPILYALTMVLLLSILAVSITFSRVGIVLQVFLLQNSYSDRTLFLSAEAYTGIQSNGEPNCL